MSPRLMLAYGLIALIAILTLALILYQVRRSRERHRNVWGNQPRRR